MAAVNPRQDPKALFIMGPTASGKTDLAVELAETLGGDIISVDSAMVYRGLDIGSAKPDAEVLARAPHQLIDIRDPWESYSAGDFAADARAAMAVSHAAGRVPLLVGGTMMYFRALQEGLAQMPLSDAGVRANLEACWLEQGPEAMHQRLAAVDAVAAAGIHPNNRQRVLRALEVYTLSGRPISKFWEEQALTRDSGNRLPYTVIPLALCPANRSRLHERIAQRFSAMLAAGLVDEVAELRRRPGLHGELPAMRSVGYRQVWDYLEGYYDRPTMEQRGLAATRQLAKRQLTWLRKWSGVHWLDSEAPALSRQALKIVA
ncbi:MAG: tRNA (adenosine(37)-N6)-dimethylallyltransferase MiaA [Halomonadaceae bacterium]|nr:MAG: tRNA (adenosine(37)-N6)-dimethylallyltransferase MiaA [Halomonadaceae bacterium]